MNVLFVDNLLFEGSKEHPRFDLQPHLGLMSLAAVARNSGHDASIYDVKRDLARGCTKIGPELNEFALASIIDHGADIVGFTALGCNFPFVIRLAKSLKSKVPGTTILLGGPHATILHRQVMETFPWIDAVVRNEAEETFPKLLECLAKGSITALPGLTFRDTRGRVVCAPGNPVIGDLDSLPLPDYSAYPIADLMLKTIRVEAGRGCPFSCSFCSTASFFGREYRLKSADRLVREMHYLRDAYGFTDFKLNHDLFTVNKRKVREFCDAVAFSNFTWGCSARMDCVDRELLEAMAAAGCRRIYFGVEAGSPRMQRISRKRLDLALVRPTLDITEALGIQTVTSFITGYPEESLEDHQQTLSLGMELHCRRVGLNTSQLHFLTPEPGTDLVERYGDQLDFDAEPAGFNLPILSSQELELIRSEPHLFGNYYSFPSPIGSAARVAAKLFESLVELTRDEIRYIMDMFEGGFCQLTESFAAWRSAFGQKYTNVGLPELADHLAHSFGSGHPAVSVLRLRQALIKAGELGAQSFDPSCVDAITPATRLRVSDSLQQLTDIHDPHALREHVYASVARVGEDQSRATIPRLDLAIVASTGDSDRGVAAVAVSPGAFELLRHFLEPANYWEYCASLANAPADAKYVGWEDLKSLVEVGLLVPQLAG